LAPNQDWHYLRLVTPPVGTSIPSSQTVSSAPTRTARSRSRVAAGAGGPGAELLAHVLDLPATLPTPSPSRGPPQQVFDFDQTVDDDLFDIPFDADA
jgi:hypothetical protein